MSDRPTSLALDAHPTILHLVPTISRHGAGVAEAVRLLAGALDREIPGCVSVLATHDEDTERDLPEWPDVPVTNVSFFGPARYRASFAMLRALLARRVDIVHVHGLWTFHAAVAMLWQAMRRGSIVISPHGMLEPWILARSRTFKRLVRFAYQDRLINGAACLHALTEKERGDITLAYPKADVAVVPNFVDLPPPGADPGKPGWWRDDLVGKDIYLFLGRLHEKKGCLELLDAWDALCAADPAFRNRSQLVFCGWNHGLEAFDEHLAASAGRCGNVVYVGAIYGHEKAQTLGVATFFVLPSKSEGLPMTVLEAWAVGAVVIMTPECNLEIGFERDAAIRTGTTAAEIEVSLRIAGSASAEKRVGLTDNGRALVAERYAAESAARSMVDLYRHVLARSPNRTAQTACRLDRSPIAPHR